LVAARKAAKAIKEVLGRLAYKDFKDSKVLACRVVKASKGKSGHRDLSGQLEIRVLKASRAQVFRALKVIKELLAQ
jgi:hypothetical protein